MSTRTLPDGWADDLPSYAADPKGVATRKASGEVLTAIAPVLPGAVGRLGRPGGVQQHDAEGRAVVRPGGVARPRSGRATRYGRVLHFGIREHAMGSIMNGIALHGGTRVYGGTFLVFSDYMRPAVRLAALMQLPVTYVWTHDSIGLGEDGPTHQPVEHLAALRAIPGLDVVRPADANETAAAWQTILEPHRPPGRPGADPPERAGLPARRPTGSPRPRTSHGRLRPDRRRERLPRRRPHRHRLRGPARRRGPRPARPSRASAPGSCPCRAGSGSTPRTRPTATASSRRP